MEIYKYGKVVSIGKAYVIFESNYSGNIIYVPNTELFKVDEMMKIFVHKYTTDFTSALYGFRNFKERLLFEDLITINGIGPKTAIGLLKDGKDPLIEMLADGDATALSSFPYLGIKTANQIVFELSDKYRKIRGDKKSGGKKLPHYAREPLQILGFSTKQINYALKNIVPQPSIELLVEEAIKVISNAKFT